MKKSLLVIAMCLSASATNAKILTFDYSAVHDTAPWTVAGSVTVDVPDSTTGILDAYSSITDWDFTWTDGSSTFSTNSTLEGLWSSGYFDVDFDFNEVIFFALCSGTCQTSNHPEIYVENSSVNFTTANGAIFSEQYDSSAWTPAWSTGRQNVPEPATLALLGLGLAGLASTRRRKQ